MLAAELHAHSVHSHDGRDPVEALLERAADADLDALAVTDHDAIEGSLEAADRAADFGLIGIPGIEVTTAAGHLLGIGVRERIPSGRPFTETVERIRDAGGVAVVPHPFQESRHGVAAKISRDELALADAIEIYNSRLLTGRGNRRAERFARDHGLPVTAGSDAHVAAMVGRAVTHVDAEDRSVAAICDAIRDGRTEIEGRRTPWLVSFRQAAGGVRRRFRRRLSRLFES